MSRRVINSTFGGEICFLSMLSEKYLSWNNFTKQKLITLKNIFAFSILNNTRSAKKKLFIFAKFLCVYIQTFQRKIQKKIISKDLISDKIYLA